MNIQSPSFPHQQVVGEDDCNYLDCQDVMKRLKNRLEQESFVVRDEFYLQFVGEEFINGFVFLLLVLPEPLGYKKLKEFVENFGDTIQHVRHIAQENKSQIVSFPEHFRRVRQRMNDRFSLIKKFKDNFTQKSVQKIILERKQGFNLELLDQNLVRTEFLGKKISAKFCESVYIYVHWGSHRVTFAAFSNKQRISPYMAKTSADELKRKEIEDRKEKEQSHSGVDSWKGITSSNPIGKQSQFIPQKTILFNSKERIIANNVPDQQTSSQYPYFGFSEEQRQYLQNQKQIDQQEDQIPIEDRYEEAEGDQKVQSQSFQINKSLRFLLLLLLIVLFSLVNIFDSSISSIVPRKAQVPWVVSIVNLISQ